MDTAMTPEQVSYVAQVMIHASQRRFCIDGYASSFVNSAKDYWRKAAEKIAKKERAA